MEFFGGTVEPVRQQLFGERSNHQKVALCSSLGNPGGGLVSFSLDKASRGAQLSKKGPDVFDVRINFPMEFGWISLNQGTRVFSSSSNIFTSCSNGGFRFKPSFIDPSLTKKTQTNQICRAAEYQFPDPIPEFAEAETEKFRAHLLKRLSKKEDTFGDSIEEVVGICTEIFGTFLHTEYGGPGTLLVIPFIDMADTLNEQGLPGGPQAARAAVKWAENHVDKDWKEWTSGEKSR